MNKLLYFMLGFFSLMVVENAILFIMLSGTFSVIKTPSLFVSVGCDIESVTMENIVQSIDVLKKNKASVREASEVLPLIESYLRKP